MNEGWYNVSKLYGCSGVLNGPENDCGRRKSSHFDWHRKTGHIRGVEIIRP